MIILIIIISLSLLIIAHELGHFFAAKLSGVKVEEFGFGFPPRLFSKRYGETRYSFNLIPFGGFVRLYGEDPEKASIEKRMFVAQAPWRRAGIIVAGITANVLVGWLLLSGVFMTGAPQHLVIVGVVSDSPAELAGLQAGDIVLEAQAGELRLTDPITGEAFIESVGKNPSGTFLLTVQRGEEIVELTVTGRESPPEGEGSLGVSLVDMGIPQESFFSGLVAGAETTIEMLKLIVVGFYTLFSKMFVSPEILKSISGPVGIFVMAKGAGSLGVVYLMQFIAFISLNLAVLNLIPFPALDGGRFLLVIIEKLKGSPISRRIQIAVNAFGLVLLLILMVVVTVQDIGRLFM